MPSDMDSAGGKILEVADAYATDDLQRVADIMDRAGKRRAAERAATVRAMRDE